MEIDEKYHEGRQEEFLKTLIGKTIKIKHKPNGWCFYYVLQYEHPSMLLKVQDTWKEDKPEYLPIGHNGKLSTIARTIEIVGSDGMSFAHEAT